MAAATSPASGDTTADEWNIGTADVGAYLERIGHPWCDPDELTALLARYA